MNANRYNFVCSFILKIYFIKEDVNMIMGCLECGRSRIRIRGSGGRVKGRTWMRLELEWLHGVRCRAGMRCVDDGVLEDL